MQPAGITEVTVQAIVILFVLRRSEKFEEDDDEKEWAIAQPEELFGELLAEAGAFSGNWEFEDDGCLAGVEAARQRAPP